MTTCPFTPEEIASEGIKPEEYEEIVSRLGRHPNKAELGMFGVMWSEHCCYKNSRPLLSGFPTKGDRVLVGPGENAGVVDMGDGLHLAFKIESHNHPSAIEPFQGAATGVGGILRDIFTMGARPIALLNSLRFGTLDNAQTRRIFQGVVEGISHYGNCVGVPTVGGEVYFDKAYAGNPLVNAMALGLMETEEIIKSGAYGIGNPVLYVGSTTGRDGMGGASFASAELTDESMDDRPAVQVGDPFTEKSLIEACLEAFKTGAVAAAQDMGAAGLTCSTAEMAAKGGVGVLLDLDKIPVRETGMVPYEYLLSESQERMLFVAHQGREQELIDIFHRWGLQAVVAGEVIAEPIVKIMFKGEVAAEVQATALSDNTPIYHRELMAEAPKYAQTAWAWSVDSLPNCDGNGIAEKSWNEILLTLLDVPTIASKKWIYRQYDHQVQNNTVIFPGGADAAVVRVRPVNGKPDASTIGVAACTDCNPRYVYLNPLEGAKAAVAEAARNLSCVGAEPLAITNNLNFGSPEKPVGYWQLANACKGIAEACRELDTPVTGGNVSLYNETLDSDGKPTPIYPTPVIGMVGRVEHINQVCGLAFQNAGDKVYLLGTQATTTLGGSEYLNTIHNTVAGIPPQVDFELEKAVQKTVREAIAAGLLNSAHDLAEGGLAVALAECCIGGKLGATVEITGTDRLDAILFGETCGKIIVSVAPDKQAQFEAHLTQSLADNWQVIGSVSNTNQLQITVNNQAVIAVSVEDMTTNWSEAIARRLHP
ncbi:MULTISPECIES: phosphoribosylformylglycinamidine synthase subunit PurL [Cyanophyceae]|uniref:phosphoribosylformylglycinamidine synthase subunit PurL n=1 Tax=Cyanophyceae TaxID=3028117 RepID=UPI00016DCAFB|nr:MULTISPECIES: phosphoribosylformylglycinamidine synthase subunit PurL [Cyanophyceae]ACA99656.1 phosphoribosylformylglycinamidine synthase II [Picosynechococcus sp. PCC 7002]SMH28447.1 phosphoribosylformylglycinamidine synthase subunit II [Picosynechococcus sp. OG1]SMQ83577.1 phosphoribosylformylglycinamidine synthase subunit II [Synechococcus sp. 7002]